MSAEQDFLPQPFYQPDEADRRSVAKDYTLNRTWVQPLPGHARLSALVGPEPLHLEFECDDDDFEFAFSSSWPLSSATSTLSVLGKSQASSRQADIVKIAETLNRLVRLYAVETGNTHMHVLVEARRGVVGVPPWWDEHPCLFATFAFDTNFSEVGLFSDPVQAFAAMEMVMVPHRLMLAVGPARPDWTESDDEEAWLDADSQRINALKRIEAQISKDIARLMANTHNELAQMMMDAEQGGLQMEEALVEGLSRVRGAVQKMRGAIIGYEQRRSKKRTAKLTLDPRLETPAPVKRQRVLNNITAAMADRHTLASTVRELQGVLKKESASAKMPLPARATFRRGLTALTTLEQTLRGKPLLAPKTTAVSPMRTIVNKIAKAVGITDKKKLDPRLRAKRKLSGILLELLESADTPEDPVLRPNPRRVVKAPAPSR